jgi:hypothetical protein
MEAHMKTIMVRYTTSEAHAPVNEANVRRVFDELRALAPEGFIYTTYRLAGGTTFVHVATHNSEKNPLLELPAFKTFRAELEGRCVEGPIVMELNAVASYPQRSAS